jgi:nicotinamidase-related amidase
MAALTLPLGTTALLVMDCQNDNTHEQGKMAPLDNSVMARLIKERGTLRTIAKVSAAARAARVPVIHVRHGFRPDGLDVPKNMRLLRGLAKRGVFAEGTWGAEINAEVEPQAQDIVIVKSRTSSFYASPLEAILNSQGITHLILTGIATDGVVAGTAYDAADRGYHIIIPEDCCAAGKEEVHRALMGGVLSFLSTVCKSGEVIEALARG